MPRIRSRGIRAQPIFLMIMLAMVGLYLFSQFFVQVEKTADWEFTLPEDVSATTLMVFKILILGIVTYGALILAGKLGTPLVKRDAFTLILLGIGVWFLWDKFIGPLLQSGTIEDMASKFAQVVFK